MKLLEKYRDQEIEAIASHDEAYFLSLPPELSNILNDLVCCSAFNDGTGCFCCDTILFCIDPVLQCIDLYCCCQTFTEGCLCCRTYIGI